MDGYIGLIARSIIIHFGPINSKTTYYAEVSRCLFFLLFIFLYSHLHRSLGEAGEIEPETEGMLIEHGVDYSDFSDEVSSPWMVILD